jgi:threonine dehydratase
VEGDNISPYNNPILHGFVTIGVSEMLTLSLREIQKAYNKIGDYIVKTPLWESPKLAAITGADSVWLKVEALQKTGSFKIRGVAYQLLLLVEAGGAKNVITASTGNHGLAVAYLARMLGFFVHVVVPIGAPEIKKQQIRASGATLIEFGDGFDGAEHHAMQLAKENGWEFIYECDDERVLAGHGTTGLEIMQVNPDINTLLVAAAGGGLLCGTAAAVKAYSNMFGKTQESIQPKAFGVISQASEPNAFSFQHPEVTTVNHNQSLADGLSGSLGPWCLELMRQGELVDGLIHVTEADIVQAMGFLYQEHRLVVEGAGAAAVAALLAGKIDVRERTVCVVVSGGNVDDEKFKRVIKKYNTIHQ